MAKFDPLVLTSGFLARTQINANFATLSTLIDTLLSRDGTAPNTMLDNLDMNTNRIINGADAVDATDYVTLQQLTQQALPDIPIPSQTGNADRVLQTDGTNIAWGPLVTPFAETYLDDADLATTQTTLGVITDAAIDAKDQDNPAVHVADTGLVNTVVLAPTPAITAYAAGQRFTTFINTTNTGAVTLAVSGLGAISLNDSRGTALTAGALTAGDAVEVIIVSGAEARVLGGGGTTVIQDNSVTVNELSQEYANGWVWISTTTATAAADTGTIDLPSGFDAYRMTYTMAPAMDDVSHDIEFRTSGGAFRTGADYDWNQKGISGTATDEDVGQLAQAAIRLYNDAAGINQSPGNAAGEGIGGTIMIYYARDATKFTLVQATCIFVADDGEICNILTGGDVLTAEDNDAIRLQFEFGNIATGSFTLEGLRTTE